MKVLTIYAHPDPKSFCQAVLQQFTRGLQEAGHRNEVLDLYAMGFNPVLGLRDFANWLPDANAPDVVEKLIKEKVFGTNTSWLQRLVAWYRFRNKICR